MNTNGDMVGSSKIKTTLNELKEMVVLLQKQDVSTDQKELLISTLLKKIEQLQEFLNLDEIEVSEKVEIETLNKKSVNDAGPNKNQVTILVAEDEEFNFILVQEILIDMNIELIHAINGEEAVRICKENPNIDLILMDIKMPIMDGNDATKIIKELRPELPVIAQSAFYYEQYQKIYGEDIFDKYITKPIDEHQLRETVSEYIQRK